MGKQSSDIGQKLSKAARLARTDPARAILIHYEILSRFPNNRRSLAALAGMVRDTLPEILSVTDRLAVNGGRAEALVLVETLERAAPNDPRLVIAIGRYLIGQERYRTARSRIEAALAIHPDVVDLQKLKAITLFWLGESRAAADLLQDLLAVRPNRPDLQNALGAALRSLGDTHGARAAFLSAIESPTTRAAAWTNLATIVDFTKEPEVFDKLRRYLARSDRDAQESEPLDFTFAKAAEDLGDIDSAFAAFKRGNDARKATPDRSGQDLIDRDAALLKGITHNFDAIHHGNVDWNGPRPVFVLGMPRSGTTLVERIIAAHPQAHGAGELGSLHAAVRTQLNRGHEAAGNAITAMYFRDLARIAGREALIVDKMPMNFRYIGFVLAAYPDARVVHTRRNPIATCFSNYRQRFNSAGMAFADDLDWLVTYYKQYQAYMQFWQARFADRILDLDYETLTEDQEPQTRRILDFIGLEWDPACLAFQNSAGPVQTASVMQVRRGMYRGSSDVWHRYAGHLKVLTDGLADAAHDHAARLRGAPHNAAAIAADLAPSRVDSRGTSIASTLAG